ncbi:hypothetical protein ACFWB0_20905 [Rhodococcus sp. NPDC060086]|uniref:hypothetical protein n=1 Tax=Rhodococcus sp. NPDC060086 TaxID=3347055 RepID=UPI00365EF75D
MSNYPMVSSTTDTSPIPRVHVEPGRNRNDVYSFASEVSPKGEPVVSRDRSKRMVFVAGGGVDLWFIAGVAAVLLAIGLVVVGVASSESRSVPAYDSVYVPVSLFSSGAP